MKRGFLLFLCMGIAAVAAEEGISVRLGMKYRRFADAKLEGCAMPERERAFLIGHPEQMASFEKTLEALQTGGPYTVIVARQAPAISSGKVSCGASDSYGWQLQVGLPLWERGPWALEMETGVSLFRLDAAETFPGGEETCGQTFVAYGMASPEMPYETGEHYFADGQRVAMKLRLYEGTIGLRLACRLHEKFRVAFSGGPAMTLADMRGSATLGGQRDAVHTRQWLWGMYAALDGEWRMSRGWSVVGGISWDWAPAVSCRFAKQRLWTLGGQLQLQYHF